MTNTDMVGPSYVIIGGLNAGEGMVITNSPNHTVAFNVWDMTKGYPVNSTTTKPWFLLQTKYDHWLSPPFFDNRCDPGVDWMNEVGSYGITLQCNNK